MSDLEIRHRIREALLRREAEELVEAMESVGDDYLARVVTREELSLVDWSTAQFWTETLVTVLPGLLIDYEGPPVMGTRARGYQMFKDRLGTTEPTPTVDFFGHPIVLVVATVEDDDDETKPMCIEHGPACAVGDFIARQWTKEHHRHW